MSELRKSKSRSYPPELLNAILDFVAPLSAHAIAVDLGCGPGQLTALLAEADPFERVIGVDPSEIMIERARSMEAHPKLEYTVGTAEIMQGLEDGSVSLVTAGNVVLLGPVVR